MNMYLAHVCDPRMPTAVVTGVDNTQSNIFVGLHIPTVGYVNGLCTPVSVNSYAFCVQY